MGSKVKICKCGHNSTQHKGKSKLSFTTWCRECPCSSYLNRKRPDKSDYILMLFSLGLAVFFVSISMLMLNASDPTITGTENDLITFTVGGIYNIIKIIIIGVNVLVVTWLVIDPITDIIAAKRRRTFPAVDDAQL